MPQDTLTELKPPYLETIELLRGHLKQQLGKTGPVEVDITELKGIAAPWKINRYLRQLVQDGIIEPVEPIPVGQFDEEDPGSIVLNCLKTVEEIQEYRHSLQGQSGHYVQFPISSWEVLEVRFVNPQEVVVAAHEPSGAERRTLTYGDLGFADKRTGRPNTYWEFLAVLGKHDGQLNPTVRELPHRNKVAKWKQGLKNQLQLVFRLDSDPFQDYSENQQYELKFSISYPES